MNKDKNLILYTVGGAAVIAGTYIYFKRRNMTIEQKYSQHFIQFFQQILYFKQFNQTNFQLKYDQLLYLATFEESNSSITLAEQISYSDIDIMLNQGACSQEINAGGCYYECYDCSPARQENAKELNDIEIDVSYQIICEDCFKAQGHKNHKFLRIESSGFVKSYCECGIQALVDKKCFCNKHQGFDKIKQQNDDQLFKQPKLWKGVDIFLVDSFYYYVEIVSSAIQQKLDKSIDEKTFNQKILSGNYFIKLIINKINEILELNPTSIYLISKIFSKSFNKPISFQVKRNNKEKYPDKYIRLIQKKKEINYNLTILDCLLLSYEVIDNDNDHLLSKLFHSLTIADEKFTAVLCEKFFRLIGFIARAQKSKDEWIYKSKLPTFISLIMGNIFVQSVFDHLVNTLGVDIFNPIEYLAFYIENKLVLQQQLNEIVLLLPNVCFDMFRQVKQLKTLMQRYPKELVNSINNLNYSLFFKNVMTFKNYYMDFQLSKNHFNSLLCFSYQLQVEVEIIDAQVYVFQALKLINDEDLTKNIISIIWDSFREYIQKISESTQNKEKAQENFYTFSIASLASLPYLIAISEKKMFTKSSIQNFFNNNFSFKYQEEKITFFKCLKKVISKSIFFNIDQLDIFFRILSQTTGLQLQFFQDQIKCLYDPKYKIYDLYILVSSIIFLADNNSNVTNLNSQSQKLIFSLKNPLQNDTSIYNSASQFHFSLEMYQILLDSTPLFNLFSQNLKLFFPEECQSEDTQIKKIIKSNVEELIVSCIKKYDLEKMNLNNLQEICSAYINDQNMLKEYHKEVLEQKESEQLVFLRKQYGQKLYSRHFLRMQFEDLNKLIENIGLKNKESNEEYTLAGSDFSLEKLFPYQQEIFKKIFLDEEYVRQIINAYLDEKKSLDVKRSVGLQIFLLLKLIIQRDCFGILNQEEKKQIEKIIQILPFGELQASCIAEFYDLKKQQNIVWLKTDELIFEMSKQIS
ncbi:hypothetical protein ABPG72_017459 [Tetrahymena utriculariae]